MVAADDAFGVPAHDAAESATPGHPHSRGVIVALALGVSGASAPNYALPLVGPRLSEAASLSGTQLGLISGIAGLGLTIAMLPGGDLSDRLGSNRAYRWGAVAATVGAVVAAWPSFLSLMTGMFLVGVGTAIVSVSTMANLARTFPDAKVRAFATFGVSVAILGGLTSVVIGIVADRGWVAAGLLLGVPLLVVGAVLVQRGSASERRPRSSQRGGWDPAGVIVAAVSAGTLFVGVTLSIGGNAWPSGALLLAVGFGSAVGLVMWERRLTAPLFDTRLLHERAFVVLVLIGVLSSLGTGGAAALAAEYTQLILGATATGTALLILLASGLTAVAALVSPWLLSQLGARSLVGGALGLAAIACVGAVVAITSGPPAAFLGAASLVTFALGLTAAPLRALVADSSGAAEVGRAFGMFAVFRRFGLVIGMALVIQTFLATLPGELHDALSAIGQDAPTEMAVETVGSAESMRQQMATALAPERFDAYVAAQDNAFTVAQQRGLMIGAASLVLAALLASLLPARRSSTAPGARDR